MRFAFRPRLCRYSGYVLAGDSRTSPGRTVPACGIHDQHALTQPVGGSKRGTAEQWIKEGKQATHWTRLSCHRFRANEVRLQLSVLYFRRTIGRDLGRANLLVILPNGWVRH